MSPELVRLIDESKALLSRFITLSAQETTIRVEKTMVRQALLRVDGEIRELRQEVLTL